MSAGLIGDVEREYSDPRCSVIVPPVGSSREMSTLAPIVVERSIVNPLMKLDLEVP